MEESEERNEDERSRLYRHIYPCLPVISLLENTPIAAEQRNTCNDRCIQPQDEGTEACVDAIDAAEASHIPRDVLCQLVLKCNVFRFEQIQGTTMGTKMAPSYANLFMDRFERAFLAQEPIQPLVWKFYIITISYASW